MKLLVLYLLGGMCGPERMFQRHERRLALASSPLSLSLPAPLHDGECLTVPEDKGGVTRHTRRSNRREREKQKRCDKRQQQQPRTRESNRRNRLRASSFSATAIYPHDTITLLPF